MRDNENSSLKIMLGAWQEARGTVTGVEVTSEIVVLHMSFNKDVRLEISLDELKSSLPALRGLIGHRVSVLRTRTGYITIPNPADVNLSINSVCNERF